MVGKGLFIAATGQNVGKTTLCLGMISALRKKFSALGFMKPVGQQHIRGPEGLLVDKDVLLFKEHFALEACYSDMSPVIFSRGFTRDYIDGKIKNRELISKIRRGYKAISSVNDFTLVEGTGHVAVGSIADISNAKVASLLGLHLILIATGGLGSAFDEITLNHALCEKFGVTIKGVILNRVLEDKREMALHYMTKALKPLGIPLIGAIPFNSLLSTPSMGDFEVLFKTPLIAGEEYFTAHFKHMRLVATNTKHFLKLARPGQVIVTPATRDDILKAIIKLHKRDSFAKAAYGLILTGREPPDKALIEKLRLAKVPTLYTATPTFDAMLMINTHTAKILKEDTKKIDKAIELASAHIDFDLLIQAAV